MSAQHLEGPMVRLCCEYNRAVAAPLRVSDVLRRQFRDALLTVRFEHAGSWHSVSWRPLQYCETRPAYAEIPDDDRGGLRHWVRMVIADLDDAPVSPERLTAMDPALRVAMLGAVEEAGSAWLRQAYACRHPGQAVFAWIVRIWRILSARVGRRHVEPHVRGKRLALPEGRRPDSSYGSTV
jgi:hypothetical protein